MAGRMCRTGRFGFWQRFARENAALSIDTDAKTPIVIERWGSRAAGGIRNLVQQWTEQFRVLVRVERNVLDHQLGEMELVAIEISRLVLKQRAGAHGEGIGDTLYTNQADQKYVWRNRVARLQRLHIAM